MNATTGEPDGSPSDDEAIPDVTLIPLLELPARGDTVLDAALRRLIQDIDEGGEVTVAFGNAP